VVAIMRAMEKGRKGTPLLPKIFFATTVAAHPPLFELSWGADLT
jgi:hypothetical protein